MFTISNEAECFLLDRPDNTLLDDQAVGPKPTGSLNYLQANQYCFNLLAFHFMINLSSRFCGQTATNV
jgi:hypothetical protein